MVADILNHFSKQSHIGRDQAVFNIVPQQVAEDPAKIFMPWKREKTPGIGQHPYELTQESQYGKIIHLFYHAEFLIKEPPAGAKLHLSGSTAVVEIIEHGKNQFVVAWIQIVNNGFGQLFH